MPLLLKPTRSVVLLIDFQIKLMPAIDQASAVMTQALKLARMARVLDIPVLSTEHCGDRIGGLEPDMAAVSDQVIHKHHFDACQADTLITAIPPGRDQIIIAGVEAHICVFQTAISLIERGLHTTIMVDAVGSRRPLDRDMAVASLARANARLATVEQAGFEWLGDANHPKFRDILTLIKGP
ncbi:MAG: isochorismatase family protein [Pseudomonadota bacterium]